MIPPNCDLTCVTFPSPFTNRPGMDRKRRVWPVGAVSNTTTENLSSFTRLGVTHIRKSTVRKEVVFVFVCLFVCGYSRHDLHEALGLIDAWQGIGKL